ncbi:lipase family protein [uncultured Mycolicibacterium sp.]|uniref:lipase family protein n=1 Tax=uncultured Mycolicibacterium sp. TaxID=2320817 RepID=UPI00260A94B8|nr:lipase family protein [uncultured Mycolicibacterium sp.]
MTFGRAIPATDGGWTGPAPHQRLTRGERPLPPEDDPFYRPPDGFEDAAPGTVLRSREVELAFLGVIPQRLAATQLLYRTTDFGGRPQATATTVILPAERAGDGRPCPIVSYQCAIDAVTGRCFPSYALRRGARALGSFAQFEFLLVAAALAEGWAVSVPDHEGPDGSWGAPYEPGYHVLDGIRAAQRFAPLGLSAAAPVGLWGYSGGGLASAWAAEVHDRYAPELNLVGAVLGSPVGDLGHAFRRLNGSLFAALPALVVAALADVYPELDRIIDEHATGSGKAMLDRIRRMTTGQALLRFAGLDMGRLVDRPLEEILASPEMRYIFDDIKLGKAAPRPPVLIVQALHDQIVSVRDIDALADAYLAGGASVTYHRDLFSEHMLLHPLSAPMTLRWLRDRFAGRPVREHLMRTKWPTMFNPSTYRGMLRLGLISAKVALGRPAARRPLSALDR